MQFIFDHSEKTALHIKTFWFRAKKKAPYTAGQFTELEIPHNKPDDRGIKRWFTLSSSPTDNLYSITTKFADRSSSFKSALAKLQSGTELFAADPMGDFVLPKDIKKPLLFVAGGIGITPFHSMIAWLRSTGEKRDIQLIYAASSLDEVAFLDLFKSYPMKLDVVLTNPPKNWHGASGRLDAKTILNLAMKPNDSVIYISGPEPMVESLMDQLEKAGIPKNRLVGDFFPNYTANY